MRACGTVLCCRRCQALTAATTKAVVKKHAVTMCAKRYGKDGLNTTSHQLRT